MTPCRNVAEYCERENIALRASIFISTTRIHADVCLAPKAFGLRTFLIARFTRVPSHSFAELRRQIGFDERKEFRFHDAREPARLAFLSHVKQFDFQYLSVVLNKRKLAGHGIQFKESVIKETTRLVFESLKPNLTNATVVVDGSGNKAFRQSFANDLKREVNTPEQRHVRKVKLVNSETNNLVQLAYMVCGAVWHSIRHGDDHYRKLISARELSVEVWPQ